MVVKNWSDFLHDARDANAMRPVDLTFKRGFVALSCINMIFTNAERMRNNARRTRQKPVRNKKHSITFCGPNKYMIKRTTNVTRNWLVLNSKIIIQQRSSDRRV
jgi:hypothetical protein